MPLPFARSCATIMLLMMGGGCTSRTLHPGAVWRDNRGVPIQAHGGGIIRDGNQWLWFGEDRSPTNDPAKRFVAGYASRDLVHWTYKGQALALSNPDNIGPDVIVERPKVFHNRQTGDYVMYFHLDGPDGQSKSRYALARVGVATAPKAEGPYTYRHSFRPLGLESRDIGQFIDDDGTPYLIFESRPSGGFYIASLTPDYLHVDKQVAFIKAPIEGGAIVHHDGRYYVIGSHLTGWRPNPNVYASAPSLAGPWSEFADIAPPETDTYQSQSSMLIKLAGKKAMTVIYVGDRWTPKALGDSRYIWMPLEIGGGRMRLPAPAPWRLNAKAGTAQILTVTPDRK